MNEKRIAQINSEIKRKIASVNRRTAGDDAHSLRLKLAISELNEKHALDERDYLLGAEWAGVVEEMRVELIEALRLSKRLDYMSSKRVEEILARAIEKLRVKRDTAQVA